MKQIPTFNYEYFFSQSIDLLCVIGPDASIKNANSAWCDTFGYSLEELIGKNCYEFLHPDDLNASRDITIEARDRQVQILNYINRFRHKNGEYRFLEWQCQPSGNNTYCTVRDITDLKIAEEKLQQEQNRLQAIINAQNKYLIRVDVDFKFTYTNKKFIDDFFWYYKTSDCTGLLIFDANNPKQLKRKECLENAATNPGTVYEYEEEIRNYKDQVQYIFWQCIAFVDETGKTSEIQCSGLDITARKLEELQAEALEQEKLLENNIPISTLWDGILLLPMVGTLTAQSAQVIMNTILKTINLNQAKILILDISGIAIMDTAVANYIFKISKSTQLMGCITTVCGISPAVAQTMIGLGIDITQINSTGTLQNALKRSLLFSGLELTAIN